MRIPTSPTNAACPDSPAPVSVLGMLSASARGLPKREFDDGASNAIGHEERVIVFDWDDTLCPTWWVTRVMADGLSHIVLDGRHVADPKLLTILRARKDLADPASKFRAHLMAHARCVEALLREARSLGHVRIVTLGSQPWFECSAVFFACLDIPALFKELDIEVYFATVPTDIPEGMNIKVEAKRIAMAECLTKHYGTNPVSGIRWNTFSVGDQPEEGEALKLCCESCPNRRWRQPLCKTLTLPVEPMLRDLTARLQRLTVALPHLVLHDRNAEWTLNSAGL